MELSKKHHSGIFTFKWRLITSLAFISLSSLAPWYNGYTAVKETKMVKDSCLKYEKGEEIFIGTAECMELLPNKRMAGFWIVDHEYSVYYKVIPQRPSAYDQSAAWLELSPSAARSISGKYRGERRKVYKIIFDGAASDRKGVYGTGLFSKGVLVKRIIKITEIK